MSANFPKYPVFMLAFAVIGCHGNTGSPESTVPDPKAHAAPHDTVKVVNGLEKVYSPQGWLQMEGDMREGERNGVWTSYSPLGKVKSRNEYRNGKLEGLSTVFRDNGALYYSGKYKNDKQVGRWEFYNETGNLERTVNYDTSGAVINDPR